MGFLEDLEGLGARARREVTETRVECARHADYTEERVLLACIETNEYISGEFTPASCSLPARGCSYIYVLPSLPRDWRASICNRLHLAG